MSDKLRGEMFWTDRWLSSSAFLLPIEPRGLYREMLTRAWSLGGYLPNDHEQIKRLVNASDAEWKRCWPLIEANWKQDGSKIYNPTQREVMMDSLTLREKRALAGAKGGRASGKKRSKPQANHEATPQANPKQTNPLSLSLSLEKDPTPKKNDNDTRSPAKPSPVAGVLDHYGELHPRWKPTAAEKRLVKARLGEGYSVQDCCDAIDGMHATPHNQGENDRAKKYLGLAIALRDTNIGRFIEASEGKDNGRALKSRDQERQERMIENIRKAQEADDAVAKDVQRGDGRDGGGLWAGVEPREAQNLLGGPQD